MTRPGYETLTALRTGQVVELDGVLIEMEEGELAPGDTYVGARNSVDIYTVREINAIDGWVYPDGIGYAFNTGECVKVRLSDATEPTYTVPADLIIRK